MMADNNLPVYSFNELFSSLSKALALVKSVIHSNYYYYYPLALMGQFKQGTRTGDQGSCHAYQFLFTYLKFLCVL